MVPISFRWLVALRKVTPDPLRSLAIQSRPQASIQIQIPNSFTIRALALILQLACSARPAKGQYRIAFLSPQTPLVESAVSFDVPHRQKVSTLAQCTIAFVSTLVSQPVPMLDFSRQYTSLRQEILDAVTQVCDSQHFILGPRVAAFETAAAAVCASSFAVGCASGTDALWLALAAAGIGDSAAGIRSASTPDAVITTPFSFFATASCILRAGARPIFADIDPRTFNLSPASVADVLRTPAGNDVKAILP